MHLAELSANLCCRFALGDCPMPALVLYHECPYLLVKWAEEIQSVLS